MAAAAEQKPAVLIIGGLGYVGRFLALHITENSLASELRIVDKQLPELAWLAPEFSKACSRQNYVQADASRAQHLGRIFDRKDGKQFDYVFNCGGETRYSQEDEIYKMRSHALSVAIGAEAARRKVRCFVEVSTGMVYKPDSSPRSESAKLDPWSRLAKWKLKAEEDLSKTAGLNLTIVRLAHVYGPYTSKFLATALCLARVYQSEQGEMKWLWTEDLKTNTVHVEDVARAMWTLAEWYVSTPAEKRGVKVPVYNLVDQGNTSQGTLASIIRDIFKIKTSFQGTIISKLAKLQLDTVVDDLNDDVLDPWADLQAEAETETNTPLSPFTEKELLKDTDMCMDGSAFVKQLGFEYKHPKLTTKEVQDVIESYRRLNWWP